MVFGLILNIVPFGYEMPSLMKSPSRTYDISVVRSCRCLGISLPGSIISKATAGPKDCSLFKTLRVASPLVFGNGAGIASIFEASTVCITLITFSLVFVSRTPIANAKRSSAWNTCRLIIKSDKLADVQYSRRPEFFYRSVVLLSIRAPRGHVESRWSRRGPGHLPGAFRRCS